MHLVRSPLAQAALVAALTGVLFAQGLELSPPHLTHDEIKFALQANAIADTGRDINGRLFPLYFVEPGFSVGRDPICIYVTAGVLSFLSLGDASIRFATVLVGSAAVGLLYLLARRLFRSAAVALLVAAIMALSPTYYIHSRLALSVVYPVPFTVLWLLLLHSYLSEGRGRTAYAVGVALGVGVYSYLAAAIMMPLYLTATCVVLWRRADGQGMRRVVAGFAVMLLPLMLWQAVEPDRYANIISAYRLFDDQPGLVAAPAVPAPGRPIARRVDTFWAAFDPGGLFFTGESSLQISTREVGSLLTPVAILLVVGTRALWHGTHVIPPWLWMFGLLTSPLPAVIMADVEIRRWLVVLPFVAVIAGFGVERFLRGDSWLRGVLVILLVLCGLQFAGFTRDYFGPYRERSSPWFGGNIRAALVKVLDEARSQPVSQIYISSEIPWVDAYWRFYSLVKHQESLVERTHVARIPASELPMAQPGAVMVTPALEPDAAARLSAAGWRIAEQIPDLDGSPSLTILRPMP